ncbi:MAG: acyl carrier protein [Clostridia bacterium]|nr:acyl carrier protein [Clostridia bacterium]
MNKEEIFEKLKEIIVNQLGVEAEQVKMKSTFVDDLSADSLDIVELVMNIEEEFEMEIPDEAAEKIVTVEDVVNYIEENK